MNADANLGHMSATGAATIWPLARRRFLVHLRGLRARLRRGPHREPPLAAAVPWWLRHLNPAATFAVLATVLMLSFLFLDQAFFRLALALEPETRDFFHLITDLGTSGWKIVLSFLATIVFLMLGLFVSDHRQRKALCNAANWAGFVFLCVVVSGISVAVIKWALGRARPKLYEHVGMIEFEPLILDGSYTSFPSGHATTIFAAGLALAMLLPHLRWLFFLAMWWIAMSRVFIAQHWFSDVVCAFLLASIIVWGLRWCLTRHRLGFDYSPGTGYRLRGARLKPCLLSGLRQGLDIVAPRVHTGAAQGRTGRTPAE